MAETTGLVQRLIINETLTKAWIGPKPNNTEILFVKNDGSATGPAFFGTLTEILAAAQTNFRAVVAIHGDGDGKITELRIEPV